MYPKDDFNQRLQIAFNRVAVRQVLIEIQESYGDVKNRTLDMNRQDVESIEYCEGVLEVTYIHPDVGGTTEFISWERIRGITFRDKTLRWNPLPNTPFNSL